MPDSSRIAELRRRIHEDPASIAFAQLAEEYRRLGRYDEAVSYCRSGLAQHPGYLSARVTLARALVELGAWAEAEAELDIVLRSAPDNVVALRVMAQVQQHRGNGDHARGYQQRAFALAHAATDLEEIAGRIDREIAAVSKTDEGVAGPSRLSPPVAPLLDFDALLASFGVPHATPPSSVETMLSGATPPVGGAAWGSEAPNPGPHEDELSVLERELRAFEEGNIRSALSTSVTDAKIARVDDEALRELEAWLQALSADRARMRGAL